MRCIYVAIGQKGSTIASVRSTLEDAGAMEYTTIVASPASDPAGYKYMAPYTGSAIGQHWMYQVSTSSSSSTTCPSRPRPTVRSRCCCVARRAAKHTPATSSTYTPACWSAARSCRTPSAAVR